MDTNETAPHSVALTRFTQQEWRRQGMRLVRDARRFGRPIVDAAYRTVYSVGFRAARVVWSVTKPKINGALVAIWHTDRILLIRNSYRAEWTLPGGGVDAGEAARDAAARELSEEVGLDVQSDQLRHVFAEELFWNNRRDHVTIFELRLARQPTFKIDNREVVRTQFFTRGEALALNLQPHVRRHLQNA